MYQLRQHSWTANRNSIVTVVVSESVDKLKQYANDIAYAEAAVISLNWTRENMAEDVGGEFNYIYYSTPFNVESTTERFFSIIPIGCV